MLAHWIKRAAALVIISFLVACGTQGAPARPSIGATPRLELADYRLGPGDELHVSVFGRTELTGQFPVSAQGNISYPLLGDVPAAGKTLAELTALITDRLRQGYVREPAVNIDVTKYRPFFVLGEVNQPGTFPYTPGLTVMSAVATAGGFTYRANSHRVFVQHAGEQSEAEYPLTSTTPVQPGDTVRIPERRF